MPETANIHGTDGDNLTVVLPDLSFEDIRSGLIAARMIIGPKTAKGHACSNLVEQLQHYQTATGDQRASLAKAISVQMDRLTIQ